MEKTELRHYVDVAVDTQLAERDRLFTYILPSSMLDRITERQLVWVPLRKDLRLGITMRIHANEPDIQLKAVHAPVEPEFRLSDGQWTVVTWLQRNTLCTTFEAIRPFLPPGVSRRAVEFLSLKDDIDLDQVELTSTQNRLVKLLQDGGEVSVESARQTLGQRLTTVIPRLIEAGIIERTARVHTPTAVRNKTRVIRLLPDVEPDLHRAPAQRRALEVVRRRTAVARGRDLPWDDLVRRSGVTAAALRALEARNVLVVVDVPRVTVRSRAMRVGQRIQLTSEQSNVWRKVVSALREGRHHEFLLHGVTGSGKTEIYLRAAAWALSRGRQVIMLVPEISLAAQVVERFTERFPDRVAVLHSGLKESERYRTWQAIASGQIAIVVGPRSALFAPLDNVGFIAIDEEHEDSYKQDVAPRYHAREVARQLARQHHAVLLMGSATPDIGTMRAARQGDIELLALRSRVGPVLVAGGEPRRVELRLPRIKLIDMRLELQQGNTHIFSRELQAQMKQAVDAGEQVILFLNRRGQSTFIQCRACGHVESCPFCDIPLCYHGDRRRVVCHRCGHQQAAPRQCPECRSNAIGYYGTGTQRVELETRKLLPNARVMRWDRDALKRGVDHAALMRRVLSHEVDVVVGTQMVAKGLDFPLVSTIGVISADTVLHLPDFRAAERTFQLLTQVAGRAGRRVPGSEVIVQSYSVNHYAIQTACSYNYDSFFAEESAYRRRHGYPPYRRLIRLVYRHSNEQTCHEATDEMADLLARTAYDSHLKDVDLLGPTPTFTAKIRGRYQWQILLRGDDALRLASEIHFDPGWLVDVDPVSLL